jgi:serine/threonine protein phosphatase PrpC
VARMRIEANWYSRKGTKTADNRDHAGLGVSTSGVMSIVVDGSTAGADNGEYAGAIVREMVDWFIGLKEALYPDALMKQLRRIHADLQAGFPRGSASFVIVHIATEGRTAVVHAGDCLLGEITQGDRIQWQTHPHTLANVFTEVALDELSKIPARHLLTKSFRSRERIAPEIIETDTVPGVYLISTGGYWAELSAGDQLAVIDGREVTLDGEHDDWSLLKLAVTDIADKQFIVDVGGVSPNFYTAQALRL